MKNDEGVTGAPVDKYYQVLRGVSLFYRGIVQFEEDGKELSRLVQGFEREFRPGTPDGVPDSLSTPYFYFDLRFGLSGMTVCERFLASSHMKDLNEPGPGLICRMSESYSTFYEVMEVSEQHIGFEELGTGRRWRVHRFNEPTEKETTEGDLWYVRFVGSADDALIFSAPYIFDSQARGYFQDVVKFQKEHFAEHVTASAAEEILFAECCKAFVPFWADYLTGGNGEALDRLFGEEASTARVGKTRDSDGEALQFCAIRFRVVDRAGVKKRLSLSKNLQYVEEIKAWEWFKKGTREISSVPSTLLGTLSLKRKYLMGETNSEERAQKLIKKLEKELDGVATFVKIE
jgi:hypothetical protein